MTTIKHLSIHTRLLRTLSDADLIETFGEQERTDGTRGLPSADDIRAYIDEQEAKGRVLWNACERTEPDGGCACTDLSRGPVMRVSE